MQQKLEHSNRLRIQRLQYIADLELSLKLRDKRIAELEAVIAELCVDCYQIYYDMVEAEELSDD